MAERLGQRLAEEYPELDVVAGSFRKRELADAVRRPRGGNGAAVLTGGGEYEFARIHSAGGTRAFLPIMHGCDNFCTYCIVPYVRGREVSRDPREILDEISALEARGVREITLLGQNVNSYNHAGGVGATTFPALLRQISRAVKSVRRVRFLTSHPRDLSGETIQALAEHPVFCRHIHLPVQSGSDPILEKMNRGYTSRQYLDLVERIRASLTGVSLTTDILIGFPGETDEDFQATLQLMGRAGFDDAFMYYFNPREGTPASRMGGQLSEGVKLERLAAIIEAQRAIGARRLATRIGSEVEVLVEGVSKKDKGELLSRTEWDGMAVFPGSPALIGEFVRVRLASLSGNTFRARPC
jgi:tRNA-2-methylthio-N6-dimethylallyladenosine synthase